MTVSLVHQDLRKTNLWFEDAMKALLETGAQAWRADGVEWRVRTNVFPERIEDTLHSEEAKEFKARLDAGEEILHALREAGADIPGERLIYIGSEYNRKYETFFGAVVRYGTPAI